MKKEECSNCFEGKADFDHVCGKCNGAGYNTPQPQVAAVQVTAASWINVDDRLPTPGTPVLLDTGATYPLRAMWAAKHTVEAGDDDADWADYDVDSDMYYSPEGWYEWNAHEETHWSVSAKAIAWMPIPLATTQPAAVFLPLLIRDIARDMHITTTDACIALKPLGNFSVNSAVTPEMASKLREHFPEPAAAQPAPAGEQLDAKRWMAFNIGCIECGVSSAVIGLYDTKEEAEAVCAACAVELDWREGGQNDFTVFDLHAPQAEEYRVAIAALSKATT